MTMMTALIRWPLWGAHPGAGKAMTHSAALPESAPHIPVLLTPLLSAVAPVTGLWLDGTFGAGGYTKGLLAAGADCVIGVDRDPLALEMAAAWAGGYGDRLRLVAGNFSELDSYSDQLLDGIVLDLGVSSMQLDQAHRGFSFQKDGPLDMRMAQDGPSAADIVNTTEEAALADILYLFGEEHASRRIARAIVEARAKAPLETTLQLAEVVAKCLPRPKPGQSHPATRSFQAIRIAVNAEFDELVQGLMAAERALKPGGKLAVVTFHSLEDRIVKRFLQLASGHEANANRYAPARADQTARFDLLTRRATGPDEDELARNPRSRSAKLRVAIRTNAPAKSLNPADLGAPQLGPQKKGRR
jgi:16S rRNA (cytosine1402-N4)-methyltransferase